MGNTILLALVFSFALIVIPLAIMLIIAIATGDYKRWRKGPIIGERVFICINARAGDHGRIVSYDYNSVTIMTDGGMTIVTKWDYIMPESFYDAIMSADN